MATPVKRGDNNPLLQRQTYNFDFTKGTVLTEEYKGISVAKMINLFNGKILNVQTANLTIENDCASAQFTFGDSTGGGSPHNSLAITLDRWEMPGESEEADLFFHPELYYDLTVLGTFSSGGVVNTGLIISYLVELRKGIEEKTDSTTLFTDTNFDGWDALGASGPAGVAVQDEIIRFYELYLNGQTHYLKAKYSLRHTTNTPSYWSRNVSDTNVNKIMTTAQLLSEVEDPTLWNFPLPGRLDYKIQALDAYLQSIYPSRSNFIFGWLKAPSEETSVGRSRIEIQTTYIYDQWSTDVYFPA